MAKERSVGQEIKLRNKIRILRCVYKNGKATKQQLAKQLTMSLPTVLQNIKELTAEGLIRVTGQMESTGGRKAAVISPVENVRLSLGVNVSKHHIELVLVNLTGEIVKHRKYACPYRRAESYYKDVGKLVDGFVAEEGVDKDVILGAGVAIPGIIDNAGTTITDSHVLGIRAVPCEEFASKIGYPCLFINDANAAGLAEVHTEDSLGTFAYLSLNNCVGGAIFINHKMYLGNNQRAGEFGHMRLMPMGRTCYCGMDGCVDAYCNAMVLTSANNCDIDVFFERLDAGDAELARIWDDYLDCLAITVNNLRMAFDCPIVLGGCVGGHLSNHLEEIRRRAGRLNTFAHQGDYVFTCQSRNSATALGAALLHVDRFFSHS